MFFRRSFDCASFIAADTATAVHNNELLSVLMKFFGQLLFVMKKNENCAFSTYIALHREVL